MSRRLLLGFVAFAVVVIVLLEIPLGLSLANNARSTALSELKSDASSLGLVVSAALDRHDADAAATVVHRFADVKHGIVVVLAGDRTVLVAGSGAAEELTDPATARILRQARDGRAAGEEGSHDPDDDFLYAVAPVVTERARMVLLIAEPAAAMHAQIRADVERLAVFGAIILAVAAGVGALLARSLTRPLARIEATVSAYGRGDLDARVPEGAGPAELRALGDSVNQMAGRLEELLHAQRAFVADASHQLRTPLTALRLRLENLEGRLGPEADAAVAPAIAETDRLSRVIDGLLVLARADGARPERVTVDVDAVVADRIDAWGPLAAERAVSLSSGPVEPTKARALACAGYVEQVLDNLLANALDATPPGGSVAIVIAAHDKVVDLHVTDSGAGMRAEDRVRAFDRFWRPEGSSPEGTGLGLAIVAQLVRVSGGTCWLDAVPSGGIDAVVRLARTR